MISKSAQKPSYSVSKISGAFQNERAFLGSDVYIIEMKPFSIYLVSYNFFLLSLFVATFFLIFFFCIFCSLLLLANKASTTAIYCIWYGYVFFFSLFEYIHPHPQIVGLSDDDECSGGVVDQ